MHAKDRDLGKIKCPGRNKRKWRILVVSGRHEQEKREWEARRYGSCLGKEGNREREVRGALKRKEYFCDGGW